MDPSSPPDESAPSPALLTGQIVVDEDSHPPEFVSTLRTPTDAGVRERRLSSSPPASQPAAPQPQSPPQPQPASQRSASQLLVGSLLTPTGLASEAVSFVPARTEAPRPPASGAPAAAPASSPSAPAVASSPPSRTPPPAAQLRASSNPLPPPDDTAMRESPGRSPAPSPHPAERTPPPTPPPPVSDDETRRFFLDLTRELATALDTAAEAPAYSHQISEKMRDYGISPHYLGYLRIKVQGQRLKSLVLIEMIAQCFKTVLFHELLTDTANGPRTLIADYLNLVLGRSAESNEYFESQLAPMLEERFPSFAQPPDPPRLPAYKLLVSVMFFQLLRSLLRETEIEISPAAQGRLLQTLGRSAPAPVTPPPRPHSLPAAAQQLPVIAARHEWSRDPDRAIGLAASAETPPLASSDLQPPRVAHLGQSSLIEPDDIIEASVAALLQKLRSPPPPGHRRLSNAAVNGELEPPERFLDGEPAQPLAGSDGELPPLGSLSAVLNDNFFAEAAETGTAGPEDDDDWVVVDKQAVNAKTTVEQDVMSALNYYKKRLELGARKFKKSLQQL